jgi:hypothetical protein
MNIPAMVLIVNGFSGCSKLHRITFALDGALSKLFGFQRCSSLSRVDLPSSVEEICAFDRSRDHQLLLTLAAATKIQSIRYMQTENEFRSPKPAYIFLCYAESDLTEKRRLIHMHVSIRN